MPRVVLSQKQIDTVAEACTTAINEHAVFLDDEVRRRLAQALQAMGKTTELDPIEP
jgi:hypothetical protein